MPMLWLTIAGVVLFLIHLILLVDAKKYGEDADISGCIPYTIRVLCCLVWCWWFAGCIGSAWPQHRYELVLFDGLAALALGITCILAVIDAVRDGRRGYWF